jgi:histidyl-tRNA synthetase
LDAVGVAWERNSRLVRGLDYYRHTAFEFITDRLGAQGTVLGGGRYDGLMESLGGPATPAVGWAAGIERLGMLIEAPASTPTIVVIPDNPTLEIEARALVSKLRREGFQSNIAYRGNAKRQTEIARREGAEAALYIRADSGDGMPRHHLTQLKSDPDKGFLMRVLIAVGANGGGLSGEAPTT